MGFFSGETESTSQLDPWGPAELPLLEAMNRIQGGPTWTTYGGQQQADWNIDQLRQMQGVRDFTTNAGANMANQMFGAGQQALGGLGRAQNYYGQAMNQGPVQMQGAQGIVNNAAKFANNPYLSSQIDAAAGDVTRNLYENQMPGIAAYSGGSGNLGSSRRGALEAGAMRDAAGRIQNISTQMRGNAYQQGLGMANNMAMQNANFAMQNRGNQMNAANQLGNLANMGAGMMGQGQNMWANQNAMLGNVGQNIFNYQQAGLDRNIQDHYMGQMLPYQQAQMQAGIAMGPAQGFGETTTTTPNGGTFGAIMQPIMGLASGYMAGRGG